MTTSTDRDWQEAHSGGWLVVFTCGITPLSTTLESVSSDLRRDKSHGKRPRIETAGTEDYWQYV